MAMRRRAVSVGTWYNAAKYSRFSRPVSRQYTARAPVSTVPMCRRTCAGSRTTSNSHTRAVPAVGANNVHRIRMVVVFPAPFGPSRPNNSPRRISSVSPSIAVTLVASVADPIPLSPTARARKRLVRPSSWTACSGGAVTPRRPLGGAKRGQIDPLALEQSTLQRRAAAQGVAAEASVSADHAMARHDEGHRVLCAGIAHSAHGAGVTDLTRDVAVRADLPFRDPPQPLQHDALKWA